MESIDEPKLVEFTITGVRLNNVKDIGAGGFHSMALTNKGNLFTWGEGAGGRLGHGDQKGQTMPKEIPKLTQYRIYSISAGTSHNAFISQTFELYTWGVGGYGRLGHGGESDIYSPKHVEDLKQKKIQSVSCGTFHTLCILQIGQLFAFGGGKFGKLGIDAGMEDNFTTPKQIFALEDSEIAEASAGDFHSMALTSEGKVNNFKTF
jgi:E3 ubiquitin-protein ligase HERC2